MFLSWVSVVSSFVALNLLLTCCAAGESIPIRLFLAGYEMTPTMRDINKKFSVRYYLNLVLIDEEERRYFKQQVHILHYGFMLAVVHLLTSRRTVTVPAVGGSFMAPTHYTTSKVVTLLYWPHYRTVCPIMGCLEVCTSHEWSATGGHTLQDISAGGIPDMSVWSPNYVTVNKTHVRSDTGKDVTKNGRLQETQVVVCWFAITNYQPRKKKKRINKY